VSETKSVGSEIFIDIFFGFFCSIVTCQKYALVQYRYSNQIRMEMIYFMINIIYFTNLIVYILLWKPNKFTFESDKTKYLFEKCYIFFLFFYSFKSWFSTDVSPSYKIYCFENMSHYLENQYLEKCFENCSISISTSKVDKFLADHKS
jgi:hypothetical protein